MKIELYDRNNIDELQWPDNKDGKYARNFLYPLIKEGTLAYIDNVDAEVKVIVFGNNIFPLVLGNTSPKVKNAYVCSPTAHYIDYGMDEIDIEFPDKPMLNKTFKAILSVMGFLFKGTDFDKVVFVNNWLLSTNLYPEFESEHLGSLKEFLLKNFPDRILIFRSINDKFNNEEMASLEHLGFKKVFSRQVYILEPEKKKYKSRDSFKKDVKLFRKSGYHWEDQGSATDKDIKRIRELYDLLYIDKYSKMNPMFNEKFFRESIKKKFLTYYLLRKNSELFCVVGYFERNGVITTPVFGYDTSMPAREGLYRFGALRMIEEAVANNWILHKSSGVSRFKMHRGAEPSMEYNLVYHKHLPFIRKFPWLVLEMLTKVIIIPVMKRFQL